MSKYSCVATFHTNPFTCGVARFNTSLAKALGIPVVDLSTASKLHSGRILLSVKLQEIDPLGRVSLESILCNENLKFDLFLHAVESSPLEQQLLRNAERVFAASAEIGDELKDRRSDDVRLFAPGASVTTIKEDSEINLLTFGMAHKISAMEYKRLGTILRSGAKSFYLEVSSALHEGTQFDEHFFQVGFEISQDFGGNVMFLGFLADEEVSRRLLRSTALVAFFPKGVRENNTTVMSAMAHGCAVISNLDSASPKWMVHGQTIFDVNQLETFPEDSVLKQVGLNGKQAVSEYNFDALSVFLQQD